MQKYFAACCFVIGVTANDDKSEDVVRTTKDNEQGSKFQPANTASTKKVFEEPAGENETPAPGSKRFPNCAHLRPLAVPKKLRHRGRPGTIKTVPIVITSPSDEGGHILIITPLESTNLRSMESDLELADSWFSSSYEKSSPGGSCASTPRTLHFTISRENLTSPCAPFRKC